MRLLAKLCRLASLSEICLKIYGKLSNGKTTQRKSELDSPLHNPLTKHSIYHVSDHLGLLLISKEFFDLIVNCLLFF